MTITKQLVATADGIPLYRDSVNPQVAYVLPLHLALAKDAQSGDIFNLLFYRNDVRAGGARLSMELVPVYPQLTVEDSEAFAGNQPVEIVEVPFKEGIVQLNGPEITTKVTPTVHLAHGHLRVDISFDQSEAIALRQAFQGGIDNIQMMVQLAYASVTNALPMRAQIDLSQTASLVAAASDELQLTGEQLRQVVAQLPEEAIVLQPKTAEHKMSAAELAWESTFAIAPPIAFAITDVARSGITFDDTLFQLRAPETIEDADLWLTLQQPRPWLKSWQGNWSLSDFRRRVQQDGTQDRHFPEVSTVKPIGAVPVLLENLLPVMEDTIQSIKVELRHNRLSGPGTQTITHQFRSASRPVARHVIPQEAFTPFAYDYRVQLTLNPATPDGLPEIIPRMPEWKEGHLPLVKVDRQYLPYALAYTTARSGTFQTVKRIELEVEEDSHDASTVIEPIVLTAEQPARWMIIRALPASVATIRWRPLLYADREGRSEPMVGDWRETEPLGMAIDYWEMAVRHPQKVQVTVNKGEWPGIQWVRLHLRSSDQIAEEVEPEVVWDFVDNGSKTFALWPNSIFESAIAYRYGVLLADGEEHWIDWTITTKEDINVNVKDQFYQNRTVTVSLKAPWSERSSPEATAFEGEIIYAEVHLNLSNSTETQSRVFTFDLARKKQKATWSIAVKQGDNQYRYQVHALTVDGRLLKFEAIESAKDSLNLEIVPARISNVEPPQFLVHEVEALRTN